MICSSFSFLSHLLTVFCPNFLKINTSKNFRFDIRKNFSTSQFPTKERDSSNQTANPCSSSTGSEKASSKRLTTTLSSPIQALKHSQQQHQQPRGRVNSFIGGRNQPAPSRYRNSYTSPLKKSHGDGGMACLRLQGNSRG